MQILFSRCIILYFLFNALPGVGQVFLQIEEKNVVKTIKIYPGDRFQFQLKGYDPEWEKATLESFNLELNSIYTESGLYSLDEFSAIRVAGPSFPRILGAAFQTFGTTWLVLWGLSPFTNSGFRWSDGIIGAVAFIPGIVLRKMYRYKTVKLNDNNRLRIMDIRMSVP